MFSKFYYQFNKSTVIRSNFHDQCLMIGPGIAHPFPTEIDPARSQFARTVACEHVSDVYEHADGARGGGGASLRSMISLSACIFRNFGRVVAELSRSRPVFGTRHFSHRFADYLESYGEKVELVWRIVTRHAGTTSFSVRTFCMFFSRTDHRLGTSPDTFRIGQPVFV